MGKNLIDAFEKLSQEERDKLLFKTLNGKKGTSKYLIDTYYKGLGFYVGGWNFSEVDEVLTKLKDLGLPARNYHDLPIIEQAKEKHNVKYINTIYSKKASDPFIQFFVCNALDMKI